MRTFILLIFTILSTLITKAGVDKTKIDYDYNNFIISTFNKELNNNTNEYKELNFVKGDLTHIQNKILNQKETLFCISTKENNNKLLGAILHSVNYYSTYEYLADNFDNVSSSKSSSVREFLRIRIHYMADTSSLVEKYNLKMNDIETFHQFKVSKIIKLKTPITIDFMNVFDEFNRAGSKRQRIIIKQGTHTIYSLSKDNYKLSIQNQTELENNVFSYKTGIENMLMKGGLYQHILSQELSLINNSIFTQSSNIQNVSDNYTYSNRGITRIKDKGITKDLALNTKRNVIKL